VSCSSAISSKDTSTHLVLQRCTRTTLTATRCSHVANAASPRYVTRSFQFPIVFTEGFAKLPRASQWVHFASLISMTLSIVLLIAPAAYNRLAEAGEDSEQFQKVASYLLVAGISFLAPGIAGDLYVVLAKVLNSKNTAVTCAAGLLLACYVRWFGISIAMRRPR
jgi:Family of unknown function (DUF6328)